MRHLLSVIILLLLVSCSFKERRYYIHSLDLTLSINKLGDNMYRVYLNKHDTADNNYIDLNYVMSDMPSILLHFPIHDNDTIDTIYIQDREREVKHIESKDYVIVLSRLEKNPKDIVDNYWTDSTMFKIPCVTVWLYSYLDGIIIFNGDAVSRGIELE